MGWDLITVGKHNLAFKDIESLAKELHERLGINIRYGYNVGWRFNERKNTLYSVESSFLELGVYGSSAHDFELRPDFGYDAYSLQQHFLKEGITPKFKHTYEKKYFRHDIKDFSPFSYDLGCHFSNGIKFLDIIHIMIYQECIEVVLFIPYRWFDFIECIEKNDSISAEMADLMKMRQELKKIYNSLGCNKIYLHANQGPAQFITEYYSKSWNELENTITSGIFYEKAKHAANKIGIKPDPKPEVFLTYLPDKLLNKTCGKVAGTGVLVDDFSDLQ